jgi:hypothetical protein
MPAAAIAFGSNACGAMSFGRNAFGAKSFGLKPSAEYTSDLLNELHS